MLQFNIELVDNVIPVNVACSNGRRAGRVIENPINIGATSIVEHTEEINAIAHQESGIILERLDDIDVVRRCDDISFIKVDIEGHEMECLEGATNTLVKHNPIVALEVLESSLISRKSVAVEFLKQHGYRYIYEMVAKKGRNRKSELDLVLVEELSLKTHDMVVCSRHCLN